MEKQSVCVDSSSYTAPESIYSCGGLDTSAYTFGSAAQAVPNVLDKASRRPKQHSSAIPKGVGKAKDSPTRTTIPDILQRSILEGISSADPDKQLESIIYLFDCLTSSNSLSGASDAANVLYNHNNPQLNMRDTNDILASMPQCLQSDTWELRDAAMDLTLYTLSDTMKHSKQSIYPTVFLGADDEWLPTFKLIRDLVPILCGLTPKMDSQKQQQIIDLFFRLSSEYTDLGPLYEDIIHHGIDNGNWRARATNTRLIPRKFQRDVGCIKMSILLTALVGRFRDVSQVVVSEAAKAFAHINTAIGNEQLLSCLGVLSQDCQQIVLDEQALLIQNGYRLTPTDRKISDGSPLRQLTLGKSLTEKIPEIPNLFPSAANTRSSDIGSRHILGNTALSQSSLFSGSPNPCDILDSYTPSTVHGSRPISSQKTDLPLSPDNSDAGALQISFGFAPAISVRILQLNDTDWKKRSVAIESIFIASDNIRMDTFLPHINEFVEFSTLVLQDDNFKVVLTMLHIIEKILPVVGEAFQSRVPKLSTALVNKLADNSAVIRHTSGKVLILLMQATLPELVYNTVLVYISNANPRIREEMINVLTISLLAIPDQVVDVHFLARFLAPAVKDTKAKVRYVAVEACAVLAHRMGSSEVLSALKSHGLDVDIIQMLQVRFLNTNLPSLTGNGTLEHLISPPQFGVSKSVSLPQPIPLKAVAFRITATHSQQGIHKASPKKNTYVDLQSQISIDDGLGQLFLSENKKTSDKGSTSTTPKLSTLKAKSHDEVGNDKEISRLGKRPSLASCQNGSISTIIDGIFSKSNDQATSRIYASSPTVSSIDRVGRLLEMDASDELKGSRMTASSSTDTAFGSESLISSVSSQSTLLKNKSASMELITPTIEPTHMHNTPIHSYSQNPQQHLPMGEIDEIVHKAIPAPISTPTSTLSSECVTSSKLEEKGKISKPLLRFSESNANEILHKIKSTQDWSTVIEGMTTFLEKLPEAHVVMSLNGREMVMALLVNVQNLRTTVSKLAVQCIFKFYQHSSKSFDKELNATISCLLKKIGEGNTFIIEEIDTTLNLFCDLTPSAKLIMAAVVNSEHKNSQIRLRVSQMIDRIVTRMTPGAISRLLQSIRDTEKLLPALVGFMREGLADTRNYGKHVLQALSQSPEFERATTRSLSVIHISELKEGMRSLPPKVPHTTSLDATALISKGTSKTRLCESPVAKGKKPPAAHIKPKNSFSLECREESEALQVILKESATDDWNTRYKAIEKLAEFLQTHTKVLSDRGQMQLIFDIYRDRCHDCNVKVGLFSLRSFLDLVPLLSPIIDPAIPTLVPIIASQMGASNPSLRMIAGEVIQALVKHVDPMFLAQALIAIAMQGNNVKVKSLAIEALLYYLDNDYPARPNMVLKAIVTCSAKLLADNRTEIRNSNKKLIQKLHEQMGDELTGKFSQVGMNSSMRSRLNSILQEK